jgi:putative tryptophan/tyrosine transport system substrate-binding protein
VRRREFLAVLGGTAVAGLPLGVRAQQDDPTKRVGVLINAAESDPVIQASLAMFRQELERLGWSDGRQVRIDVRFTQGQADRMRGLARELVALQPDVLFVHTAPFVAAVRKESRTVPIVFVNVSDPIGSGFIGTLARPGGQVTGLVSYDQGTVGKGLSMLKEAAPQIARVAFVSNPNMASYDYFLKAAKMAASSLGVEMIPGAVETAADIERVIGSFASTPNGGLFVPPDPTSTVNRSLIVTLAAQYRLPAVYAFRFFAAEVGLMSYGVEQGDLFRRAAAYADHILRGEKPANLPVQAPTKFETVVNLKTAKALGLTVPSGLLAGADEVIE